MTGLISKYYFVTTRGFCGLEFRKALLDTFFMLLPSMGGWSRQNRWMSGAAGDGSILLFPGGLSAWACWGFPTAWWPLRVKVCYKPARDQGQVEGLLQWSSG